MPMVTGTSTSSELEEGQGQQQPRGPQPHQATQMPSSKSWPPLGSSNTPSSSVQRSSPQPQQNRGNGGHIGGTAEQGGSGSRWVPLQSQQAGHGGYQGPPQERGGQPEIPEFLDATAWPPLGSSNTSSSSVHKSVPQQSLGEGGHIGLSAFFSLCTMPPYMQSYVHRQIKAWASFPKSTTVYPEVDTRLIPDRCWLNWGKRWKDEIIDPSLCVADDHQIHDHAELVGWVPCINKVGNFQILADGQYTQTPEPAGEVVSAGYGAVLKDVQGVVKAFVQRPAEDLTIKGSLVHECIATEMGVNLAIEKKEQFRIKSLEIVTDCQGLYELLKGMKNEDSKISLRLDMVSGSDSHLIKVLRRIRDLINQNFGMDKVVFAHMPREAMYLADLLGRGVKKYLCLDIDQKEFHEEKWRWILYFQNRDRRSNYDNRYTDQLNYANFHYLRFLLFAF